MSNYNPIKSTDITISQLNKKANILSNLTFNSTSATIGTLNSTSATIATMNSTTSTIATLNSTTSNIATINSTTLNSTTSNIGTLNISTHVNTGLDTKIGVGAGTTSASGNTVCIGSDAGNTSMGYANVGIGLQALQNSPNVNRAVGVGMLCMKGTATGAYSIALGYKAGESQILDKSIIINANDQPLNASTVGFFINPIAGRAGTGKVVNSLHYDTTTKEVWYAIS